jgi:hypothetical protein
MWSMMEGSTRLAQMALQVPFFSLMVVASAGAGDGPEAKIREIYRAYVAAETGRVREPSIYDPTFYSARIKVRIAELKRACAPRKDLCLPDSDFLVGGQDFRIRDLRLVTSARTEKSATVSADFRNFAREVHLTYLMVLENGRWVIDDLKRKTTDGDTYGLEDLLQPLPQ